MPNPNPADEKAVAELYTEACRALNAHPQYRDQWIEGYVYAAARIRAEVEREAHALLDDCHDYLTDGIIDENRAQSLIQRINAAIAAKAGT